MKFQVVSTSCWFSLRTQKISPYKILSALFWLMNVRIDLSCLSDSSKIRLWIWSCELVFACELWIIQAIQGELEISQEVLHGFALWRRSFGTEASQSFPQVHEALCLIYGRSFSWEPTPGEILLWNLLTTTGQFDSALRVSDEVREEIKDETGSKKPTPAAGLESRQRGINSHPAK